MSSADPELGSIQAVNYFVLSAFCLPNFVSLVLWLASVCTATQSLDQAIIAQVRLLKASFGSKGVKRSEVNRDTESDVVMYQGIGLQKIFVLFSIRLGCAFALGVVWSLVLGCTFWCSFMGIATVPWALVNSALSRWIFWPSTARCRDLVLICACYTMVASTIYFGLNRLGNHKASEMG
eukprot:gnl/MRDRNA2_/MRDRNA2_428232_c0_seq1.p1 gnl/MRDRNA2_/MRDRNA2_428232_c0~~gnl/MRDRNA2_/MRDRNA2_428232_c0_seq1.p1  ORF type:complete len:193 (+),score=10.28 gnl/MRDRNA2_/MRDRNA2_428232_c0_seq1:45-581(+)